MFDSLNRYGLPIKYAVIGFVGGILGAIISFALELTTEPSHFVTGPIATAIGGYIGGWIRQKRGKTK